MAKNLSNQIKITRVSDFVAAGTSNLDSASVDMANWEGVVFIAQIGVIESGAATSTTVEQSADDSSFAALLGSGITVADDDDTNCTVTDIFRPIDRYLRSSTKRATQNSTVDGIIAIQYGPRVLPTTNDSTTVISTEKFTSPAEGTA